MKNLFNINLILVAFATVFILGSCKKEELPTPTPTPSPTDSVVVVTANADAVSTNEGITVTANVLSNDSGTDITILSVGTASNGTTNFSSDSVTYTPNIGFTGSDSFTYTITDLDGEQDNGTVSVTVVPTGVVIDTTTTTDTTTTDTTTTISNNVPTVSGTIDIIGTQSYDISPFLYDADGDAVTIVSITGASNGVVNVSGSVVSYTPNTSTFVGQETLTVTINDGQDDATGTVTLNYTSDEGETYALIAPYFGTTFEGGDNVTALTINSDGSVTSNSAVSFYGFSINFGTWEITTDGTLIINGGTSEQGIDISYTVSELETSAVKGLVLTGTSYTHQVWNNL